MRGFAGLLILLALSTQTTVSNQKFDKWKVPGFFKGFNILYESPKSYQNFVDMKNYGGNLFQIGTKGFYQTDKPYDTLQANIDSTNRFVSYCDRAGIYYVIAVRSGPGAYDVYEEMRGITGESRIWDRDNAAERTRYADMLKEIVERYGPDSLFAGINIVVEPRPKINSIPANSSGLYKRFLENIFEIHMDSVYDYFVNEIRKINLEIPIILESFALSNPELFPPYVIRDPYIVYDAHMYIPYELTHSTGAYIRRYPGNYKSITNLAPEYYDKDFIRDVVLNRLRKFQQKTNVPIFIGEFGIRQPQYGGYLYLQDLLGIFQEYGWHFALWDWRRNDGTVWNVEKFPDKRYWETVKEHLSK